MKLSFVIVAACLVAFSALVLPAVRGEGNPLAVKVSLTKPYPHATRPETYSAAYRGKDPNKIVVEYAVLELAKQANLGYDFYTSLANTDPICRESITPQVEGITLGEALDKILKPMSLGYEILNGKIVLKESAPFVHVEGAPLAAKVSLTKPYPESYEQAGTNMITIQYAVFKLARQVGLKCDFEPSEANTDPSFKKYITPEIEGIAFGEALDKILKPEGLDYKILEDRVVLIRLGAYGFAGGDLLKTRVSLQKPYPATYKGAKAEKISIQYAVLELAKQAGLGFDFKTSYANTNPICKVYVTPHIEGIILGEALDQILKPEGLGFEILDGRIVLKKLGAPVGAGGNPESSDNSRDL